MCKAIYRGKIDQPIRKITDGHFYDPLRILKKRKKLESFVAHFEHHFATTIPHTDLSKYMRFKILCRNHE